MDSLQWRPLLSGKFSSSVVNVSFFRGIEKSFPRTSTTKRSLAVKNQQFFRKFIWQLKSKFLLCSVKLISLLSFLAHFSWIAINCSALTSDTLFSDFQGLRPRAPMIKDCLQVCASHYVKHPMHIGRNSSKMFKKNGRRHLEIGF